MHEIIINKVKEAKILYEIIIKKNTKLSAKSTSIVIIVIKGKIIKY